MNSDLFILESLKFDSYQLIAKERLPLSIKLIVKIFFLKRNINYRANYSKTLGYNTFFIRYKSSKILINI
jgi:hypothetical protein